MDDCLCTGFGTPGKQRVSGAEEEACCSILTERREARKVRSKEGHTYKLIWEAEGSRSISRYVRQSVRRESSGDQLLVLRVCSTGD